MTIQEVKADMIRRTHPGTGNQPVLPSNEAKIGILAKDTFVFNTGEEPFVTYTSEGLPAFSVRGADIAEGKEMTDDEKWAAIHEKYKGVPMFQKVYSQMVLDICASGLITGDEATAAIFHAASITSTKDILYDMQDGILGNNPTPASFFLLDFNELLADVSDDSREYSGYAANNDQRAFFKGFYSKMITYTKG